MKYPSRMVFRIIAMATSGMAGFICGSVPAMFLAPVEWAPVVMHVCALWAVAHNWEFILRCEGKMVFDLPPEAPPTP